MLLTILLKKIVIESIITINDNFYNKRVFLSLAIYSHNIILMVIITYAKNITRFFLIIK
jgi:hypothetical protein